MTALGGFVLGSLFGGGSTTEVYHNTKVIRERPLTPMEIEEHEKRLRRIKEHEPKVKSTMVPVREITEEDFIGMPLTKENIDRYNAWKAARQGQEGRLMTDNTSQVHIDLLDIDTSKYDIAKPI